MTSLLAFAALAAAFSLFARRLATAPVTAPMLFLALGAALGAAGAVPMPLGDAALHLLAEVALVVLLFLDAARIDAAALWRRHRWPLRMLLAGMPLSFVLGAGAMALLLPGWPWPLALLAAAILVPTDAALGLPVVSNPAVPGRTRTALTLEAGLNDGLALPAILILAALAAPQAAAPAGGWGLFAAGQVTLGPVAGGMLGLAGGAALMAAQARGWTEAAFEGIAALALAGLAYLVALAIGGNGFIASFAAGLGFGAMVRGRCAFVYEFTESEGQLLSWGAFFLLGATLVPEAVAALGWREGLAIAAALLVVRPAAIWLSLAATDATARDRLFCGWFGPRGLATALFALIVADTLAPEDAEAIVHLAVNAVWISALAHGLTAAPLARAYGRAQPRTNANGA
ncbi:MAG: cation:proton antiporter [Rhodobacteraceae bacterium]|nr:cation:proton antiporter [Paracoccaceae bacterium]